MKSSEEAFAYRSAGNSLSPPFGVSILAKTKRKKVQRLEKLEMIVVSRLQTQAVKRKWKMTWMLEAITNDRDRTLHFIQSHDTNI